MANDPAKIGEMVRNDPVWKAGIKEGKSQYKVKVLSYLEDRYLNDEGRPDRGTPEGQAILTLARELSGYLKHDDE